MRERKEIRRNEDMVIALDCLMLEKRNHKASFIGAASAKRKEAMRRPLQITRIKELGTGPMCGTEAELWLRYF